MIQVRKYAGCAIAATSVQLARGDHHVDILPPLARLDGPGDGFAAKYDTAGNQLWFSRIRGLGLDDANGIAVAADGSTVYLTGSTNSNFDLPNYPPEPDACCDVFIAKLDGSGAIQWIHNLSSVPQPLQANFIDVATAVATDPCGSAAFITGYTTGVMPGLASRGAQDIFVARYESGGTLGWVRKFGAAIPAQAPRNDTGYGVAVDRRGDLVVVGDVIGSFGLPNPNIDRTDWFIMKLRPEDGSLYGR